MDFFEKLTAAVNFYQGIYDYNNSINNANQAIVSLDMERKAAVQKVGKKAWPGVIVIVIVCCLASCALYFVGYFSTVLAELFQRQFFNPSLFFVNAILILWLILPIALAYKFWICNSITKKKRKAAREKWYQDNNERYEQAKESVTSLELEKQKYIEENVYVLDAFPEAYRDATAIAYMFKCVRDKRADTLKEAINLYEEQKHRWTIEQQNENIRDELWWMRFEQEQANAETQEQLRKIGRDVDMAATYTIFFNN